MCCDGVACRRLFDHDVDFLVAGMGSGAEERRVVIIWRSGSQTRRVPALWPPKLFFV